MKTRLFPIAVLLFSVLSVPALMADDGESRAYPITSFFVSYNPSTLQEGSETVSYSAASAGLLYTSPISGGLGNMRGHFLWETGLYINYSRYREGSLYNDDGSSSQSDYTTLKLIDSVIPFNLLFDFPISSSISLVPYAGIGFDVRWSMEAYSQYKATDGKVYTNYDEMYISDFFDSWNFIKPFGISGRFGVRVLLNRMFIAVGKEYQITPYSISDGTSMNFRRTNVCLGISF